MKKKAKTPKNKAAFSNFTTISNPQRQIINMNNNPCKIIPRINIIENNEEDICDEPIEYPSVNRISVNSVKTNNLHDLDAKGYPIYHSSEASNFMNYNMAKNYYTQDSDFVSRTQMNFRGMTLDDDCNVEE
jgi:uncharacterized protein YqkB